MISAWDWMLVGSQSGFYAFSSHDEWMSVDHPERARREEIAGRIESLGKRDKSTERLIRTMGGVIYPRKGPVRWHLPGD